MSILFYSLRLYHFLLPHTHCHLYCEQTKNSIFHLKLRIKKLFEATSAQRVYFLFYSAILTGSPASWNFLYKLLFILLSVMSKSIFSAAVILAVEITPIFV